MLPVMECDADHLIQRVNHASDRSIMWKMRKIGGLKLAATGKTLTMQFKEWIMTVESHARGMREASAIGPKP